jgi:hypothetical protein
MCGSHKSPTEPHHSVRLRESANHFFSLCPREKKSVYSKPSALFIVTFNIRVHVWMFMAMHTCMHTAHGWILLQTGPMHLTCADCAMRVFGAGSEVLVVEEVHVHACSGPLFLPPNGSSKMLDWGLSRIFDVKTRGDARTLQ